MNPLELKVKELEDRLIKYEQSGFWSRRDVVKGLGAGLLGLGGVAALMQPARAGSFLADMNASNPQVKINDIALVKTTAGQTINVATAAELTAALAALATAPSLLGNVIIQFAAGTYAGNFTIPVLIGNGYNLTLLGGTTTNINTTATGGTAGTASVQATVVRTGAGWTVDAYRGQWLKFTSGALNGEIRVINSNTSDTIALCGDYYVSASQNGDSFIIYSNSVIFTGLITIVPSLVPLNIQNIKTGNIMMTSAIVNFVEVWRATTVFTSNVWITSTVTDIRVYQTNNAGVLAGGIWGYILNHEVDSGYYRGGGAADLASPFLPRAGGYLYIHNGCVIENAYFGIWADLGAICQCLAGNRAINSKIFVKNNTVGLQASSNSIINNLSGTQVVYSGNGTNEIPAEAADSSWIG